MNLIRLHFDRQLLSLSKTTAGIIHSPLPFWHESSKKPMAETSTSAKLYTQGSQF